MWRTPGLVDVHAHLSIDDDNRADEQGAQESAMAQLRSGVQLVREPGSPVHVDYGDQFPTPRVIRSGRHIARPRRYLPGLAVEVDDSISLVDAVQQQAALGDGWIKLVGDWIDRSKGADSDLDPLWQRSELIDAVGAAHDAGVRVAVHVFGAAAIDDLLEARVDSIEHGTGMVRDQILEAKDLGIAITPTLAQVELFPKLAKQAGAKYPAYAKTMSQLYAGWHNWFENLVDSGVWLLPGTDAGGFQPHGYITTELKNWVGAGLPTEKAVDFGTDLAWKFLGQEPDPDSYVEYDSDPHADIEILARPKRVFWRGKKVL